MNMKHFTILATISLLGSIVNINTGVIFLGYLFWLDVNFNITRKKKTKRSEIDF